MPSSRSQLPKEYRSRSAIRKAKSALPTGITRETLHKLWVRARRGSPPAQKELRELLATHPLRQAAVRTFETLLVKPQNRFVARPDTARRPWVSLVSGGLPSLGKRRR